MLLLLSFKSTNNIILVSIIYNSAPQKKCLLFKINQLVILVIMKNFVKKKIMILNLFLWSDDIFMELTVLVLTQFGQK